MPNILDDLHWRYATKRFDSERRISAENLEIIQHALRLTPTSYGLQAMKFLFVETPALREKLAEAAYGQRALVEASHLLILCTDKSITPNLIEGHIHRSAEARSTSSGALQGYSDFLKNTLIDLPQDEAIDWLSKQVYIALGILLSSCAQLRIDALPMEGFDVAKFDEILDLDRQNLSTVLVCPLGYRHSEDSHQHYPKVRRPKDELFETL